MIVSAGIDLSVGSVVALTTVVIALAARRGVAAAGRRAGGRGRRCGLCGVVNGVLVTGLRVVPFIVTLGTMILVRGAAKGLADERRIEAPQTWLNDLLRATGAGEAACFRPASGSCCFWRSIVAGMLRYTRFGRHVFAIGSNERTARLCGIAVPRTKIVVYTLGAALAGVAGVLQFSRLSVGDPTVADGLELDVIAAVIIGGGSLSGGRGTVARHVAGRDDDGGDSDRLRAEGLPELGAADRHRRASSCSPWRSIDGDREDGQVRRASVLGTDGRVRMSLKITDLEVLDLRFPTARAAIGTDAMHPDPDYSAAYVILKTDGGLEGHGLTFTIGRGNEICVAAIEAFRHHVVGWALEDLTADLGAFWRRAGGRFATAVARARKRA